MRAFFPEDIRHRVIGKTPVLSDPQSFPVGEREQEVLAWLKENEHEHTSWVALDDVPENYTKASPLIICHDGFFECEELLLISALSLSRHIAVKP